MKRKLFITALIIVLCSISSYAQEIKVGSVNMKSVFENYYRVKEVEELITRERAAFKKSLEDKVDTYDSMQKNLRLIKDEIDTGELSKEVRKQKIAIRDEKVTELNKMGPELNEYRATQSKQIEEKNVRFRNEVVDDVNKAYKKRQQTEDYQVILDTSNPNPFNNVSAIPKSNDITDRLLADLNQNKGKEASSDGNSSATVIEPAAKKSP